MKSHHLAGHSRLKTLSVRCSARNSSPSQAPCVARSQTRRQQLQQLALGVMGLQLGGSVCSILPAQASIGEPDAKCDSRIPRHLGGWHPCYATDNVSKLARVSCAVVEHVL
jgi:hypothetical protein